MGASFRETADRLVEFAEQRMRANVVPGVQIGLISDGDERVASLGIADITDGEAVEAHSMFRIASITKTFTAAAAVHLSSEGRLDLDAPVRKYVPEFTISDESAAAKITTRHLLLHVSGWTPGDQPGPDGPLALAEGARQQGNGQQVAPPGEYFSYNGAGHMVVGRVIEVVTGSLYEDAIRSMFLGPLGMQRTMFTTEPAAYIAGDHTVRDGKPGTLVHPGGGRWGLPAGGLRSTAGDLLRWARCHFGESRLLEPGELRHMSEPRVDCAPPGERMALVWFVRDVGKERLLLHLGGAIGQQSLLALCPARRFALTVLTNSALGSGVINTVLDGAERELLGVETPPAPAPRPMDVARFAEYEGRYETLGWDLVLARDGRSLTIGIIYKSVFTQRSTPAPATIGFWDDDRVVGTDGWAKGQYGDFLRDAAGRVQYFRWGPRACKRLPA